MDFLLCAFLQMSEKTPSLITIFAQLSEQQLKLIRKLDNKF